MKYNFRKIWAKDDLFQDTKLKNKKLLDEFTVFMSSETKESDMSTRVESGKIHSYVGYLVRLIIIISEQHSLSTNNYNNDLLNYLIGLRGLPDYKKYNLDENRFPNATINTFERFMRHKSK